MKVGRLVILFFALVIALIFGAYVSAVISHAQVVDPQIRPDLKRALKSRQPAFFSQLAKGWISASRTESTASTSALYR